MLGQRRTRWANTAPAPAELPRLLGYCLEAGPALKQNNTTTTPICGIGGGGGGAEEVASPKGGRTRIGAHGANAKHLSLVHSPWRRPIIKATLGQCRHKLVVCMK